MKYIKLRGANYNEVMMKLKMEYGDDAIPISHKFVKEGGLFNSRLFAREMVELTAAVQERKPRSILSGERKGVDFTVGDSVEQTRAVGKKSPPLERTQPEGDRRSAGFTFNEKLAEACGVGSAVAAGSSLRMPSPGPVTGEKAVEDSNPPSKSPDESERLSKELEEIKRAIYKITSDRTAEPLTTEDANLRPFKQVLKNNDFDDEQCSAIINEVKNSISREDLKDRYKIEKSLKDLLKSKIVTAGPITAGGRRKVVLFIGPTGVGKTTTMAKLGAISSLREGRSVSFVTIDNYRIAATEQLKKYAEIMNIPIHPVNSQKEFKDIIASEKADIIMVDTSGRSHRNDLKISEIKSYVEAAECDCEKILCVSANTKKSDLNDVFRAFSIVDFNSVIITKVDETSYIGNVVDIADKYNKPIAYFTNGQEVPNDIVLAEPDKLVDMMIGNVYH